MITEDYVNFEVAKLLKEKGFIGTANNYSYLYSKDGVFGHRNSIWSEEIFPAPTLQMACKWLREEYNLYVSPTYRCFCGSKKNDKPYYKWEDRVLKLSSGNQIHPQIYGIHEYYETYEEAVEAALKYVLENLI